MPMIIRRRGNIRFKRKNAKDRISYPQRIGLATKQLLPAIVEQNQQEDGGVIVPEVLRKWIGRMY